MKRQLAVIMKRRSRRQQAISSIPRQAVTILVLSVVLCVILITPLPAEEEAGIIDNTRATLEKWVETRRIISQEKSDWALGREMLGERIKLLESEIASLRGKIKAASDNITEADEKRAAFIEENNRLKEGTDALGSMAVALEIQTRKLLKRLPDPIRDRVKPLSQRLPDDGHAKDLSLSERFQNIVGILNEVNKFNREITATSEVRSLADGTSAEVASLYIGISQAYYANAKGTIGGVGTSSAEGWTWKQNNEAAGQIVDAIAILKNEKVASFVPLPVEIE